MDKPQNGFEFLEILRNRNGKKTQSYRSFSKYLDIKAREKNVPIHGQFELTPLCNFDCKMCYVHLNTDQLVGQEVLPVETWKNLMHQAFEAGMISATLTGGECLTYPGFDDIYLYLHDLGCEVSVLTNGYLLDDRRIEFFRCHMPGEIKITLYGWNNDVYERVTGRRAFDKVVDNIQKAKDIGIPVSLSVTPSRYLGEDVFETITIGRKMDKAIWVNSNLFAPREETGRSNQADDADRDLYVRIYQFVNALNGIETKKIDESKLPPVGGEIHKCDKHGLFCGAGRSSFVIDWKGKMMPCSRMDMISAYPLLDGFKKAWDIVNREANCWPCVPECQGCVYSNVCDRCAANMLKYAEPGEQPLGLCERTRFFVQHGVVDFQECE